MSERDDLAHLIHDSWCWVNGTDCTGHGPADSDYRRADAILARYELVPKVIEAPADFIERTNKAPREALGMCTCPPIYNFDGIPSPMRHWNANCPVHQLPTVPTA